MCRSVCAPAGKMFTNFPLARKYHEDQQAVMTSKEEKNRIGKLIEFFKTLSHKRPDPEVADYSSWDQTEADYQREQAAWLAKVARRKKQKTDKPK